MAMVKLGDNFTFYAATHTPSTGAAVDADAAPGYRVYEDESGTPLLTGSMALLDDAGTTGFYSEQIAVTTANGFEAGKCYVVRITGVVSSVTGVALVPFQVQTYDLDDVAIPGSAMTLASGAITAAVVATGAIDADALAADAGTEIGTAVWASTTRTLTQAAASVAAAVAGSTITITRGDSLSAALTGLGNISTRTKLWFTVKTSVDDADTAAIIQIEETGGLLYLNGAAGTAANGDITVTNETTGAITITLSAASTAALTAVDGLTYDVQMLTATAVTTLTTGSCVVSADVTKAVS